jgi:phenylalanyl-tRNA synthetase beta chain
VTVPEKHLQTASPYVSLRAYLSASVTLMKDDISNDPHAFLRSHPKPPKPFVAVEMPYCDYYLGCMVENITVRPSSDEVQAFLKASGIRPINNIVDVTNFVLLEQGQPLHAFDAEQIEGSLCIRTAREGEHLKTLDGVERALPAEAVVVADEKKVLSLAGIMGGEESGISDRTSKIFIECAHFNANNIRVVSQKTNLSSDSAYRFERFVDKTCAPSALVRAIELLRETCPDLKVTFFTESGSCEVATRTVRVRLEKIRRLLGFDAEEKSFCDALEALGFRLRTVESGIWDVAVSSFRPDVTSEADFAEEFVRWFGADRIPSNVPGGIACELTDAPEHVLRLKHAEILSNAGFYECYTDSLNPKLWYDGFLPKEQVSALTLEKPLSEEHACLRFSLIPGLVSALSENRNRGNPTERFFETGRIFKVNSKGQLCECFATAFVVCPLRERTWKACEDFDFYRAQALVKSLIAAGGQMPSAVWSAEKEVSPLWQDGYGGTVGRWEQRGFEANLGYLNLNFTQRWFKEEAVLAAECFWLPERIRIPSSKSFQPYAETPTVTKDLALWVPRETLCETVRQALVKLLKKLAKHPVELRDVRVFDVFEDVKNNRKSFAFTLTFGASAGTLKDEQVRPIFEGLQQQIEKQGVYRVRDGN